MAGTLNVYTTKLMPDHVANAHLPTFYYGTTPYEDCINGFPARIIPTFSHLRLLFGKTGQDLLGGKSRSVKGITLWNAYFAQMSTREELEQRKRDHIELAFASQSEPGNRDRRFHYEPLLAPHPMQDQDLQLNFLGKSLRYPLWVSSMTGGTKEAVRINENLARMCGEFGLGMGLGSCRVLLDNPGMLPDFDVRRWIGKAYPLYANLGIAQVDKMLAARETQRISDMIALLDADGLIIHINPLQEWLQPGGDRFSRAPVDTLCDLLAGAEYPVIVKEVGQGMGPESLTALLMLPLAAVELAAHGGTNFATLELLRQTDTLHQEHYKPVGAIGHSAVEMIEYINRIHARHGDALQCRQVIISGGVGGFLDGFYLMKRLSLPSIYGHASGFLKYALESYDALQAFARIQVEGLKLANTYLRVR